MADGSREEARNDDVESREVYIGDAPWRPGEPDVL